MFTNSNNSKAEDRARRHTITTIAKKDIKIIIQIIKLNVLHIKMNNHNHNKNSKSMIEKS